MNDASTENTKSSQPAPNNKKKYDSGQGGFVAVLHSLESKFYGPDSPINIKGRVLLYIRHRALRDFQKTKQIPKSEIIEAVGAKRNKIEDALRELEKEKHIRVTRTKVGKVWGDNVYELHPSRYGSDYIYRPEKPSFKVIYGSKGHKSNKKPDPKDIHNKDGSYPQNENDPSKGGVGVPPGQGVGSPPQRGGGSDINDSESFNNSSSKNPLKEPIERTLYESNDDWNKSGEKEAAIAAIHKLVGMGMRKMP